MASSHVFGSFFLNHFHAAALEQLARAFFPGDKLKKILDQLKEDADALDRICNFADKELQNESRALVRDVKTEITQERIEAVIERAAAAEERKLNEIRWKNLEERQNLATEHLKALIEKQELTRISIEKENANRRRQERGKWHTCLLRRVS